jgi:hypothetical protein
MRDGGSGDLALQGTFSRSAPRVAYPKGAKRCRVGYSPYPNRTYEIQPVIRTGSFANHESSGKRSRIIFWLCSYSNVS